LFYYLYFNFIVLYHKVVDKYKNLAAELLKLHIE